MNEEKVGRRIAHLRDSAGMTQVELAEKLGVTDRAVSKWENGDNYPDITLLPVISDVFGVTIDHLLRGTQVKRQKILPVSPNNTNLINNVNSHLAEGWTVADLKICADSDGYIGGIAVIEKESYE